ncbi:SCO2400 family protein [Streptomyces albogriseolus]|uniref:SCO2400 family protein n=1 Tax=Streptomyces albogriseolus TaxID=1887 RepID=UPI0033A33630
MAVPCPDRAGRACADARYDTSGRQRMDYCSTCRRHLNGALVCPGCGAYAPDIAPGVAGGHRVPGPAATASGTAGAAHRADAERPAEADWFTAPARPAETTRPDEVARSSDTTWPVGAGRPGGTPRPVTARSAETPCPADPASSGEAIRSVVPARRAETAVFAAPARSAGPAQPVETGPDADAPRAQPAGPGTGRAARRRQLARWKKTQRRALVATAVALVGGGITLASTDRGGNDRAQAATAPDLHGMGGTSGTTDETAGAPSASPDRTTAPPQADGRRSPARPEAAPTTAPPSGTHTDGAAATEVPAGGRSDAPEPVSRSGDRSEASQDTGGGSPGSGDSTTPTRPSPPPPAADDGGGTGAGTGDGGSDQGDGSTTQPAPSTPPPADEPRDPRLCLLVICLG